MKLEVNILNQLPLQPGETYLTFTKNWFNDDEVYNVLIFDIMKRNDSIKKLKDLFNEVIKQIENSNQLHFEKTATAEKDGIELFKVIIDLK